jgi:hypothetical protein
MSLRLGLSLRRRRRGGVIVAPPGVVLAQSVPRASALGVPLVSGIVEATALASSSALGSPSARGIVQATALPSSSAFGLSIVAPGNAKQIVDAALGTGHVKTYSRADLGVTADGSNRVYQWNDLSGNGFHWAAPGANNTWPLWITGAGGQLAVRGDGVDDYMQSSYVPPAPGTTPSWIWFVVEQLSWTNGDPLFNSTTGFVQELYSSSATPNVRLYNGATATLNPNMTLATARRCEALFNNATTDYLKVGATNITGLNAGNAGGGTGRRLFRDSSTVYGNFAVYEEMRLDQDPGAGVKASLDAYASSRYGAGVLA